MSKIVNAAPVVINRGTEDLSTTQLPREKDNVPQHLPKFFIQCEKGSTEPQLVVGSDREIVFGKKTFDSKSEYHNHQTEYANLVNAEGNTCMIQRIIPPDSSLSTLRVSLEITEVANMPVYQRNVDGSFNLDPNGDKQDFSVAKTTLGYRGKWVAEEAKDSSSELNFGAGVKIGNKYPIFDFKMSSVGGYGNLVGIKLNAVTKNKDSIPVKLLTQEKAFPYTISLVRKNNKNSLAKTIKTIFNEPEVNFTLKPGSSDPTTTQDLYLDDVFIDNYSNLNNLRYDKVIGDFGNIHVYESNIDTILTMLSGAEINYNKTVTSNKLNIDNMSVVEDDKFLFNFFNGATTNNNKYDTFVIDDDSIKNNGMTISYALGGSDGDVSDVSIYENGVVAQLNKYLDSTDPVQEIAVNVESIVYDSGFTLNTKLELCQFISLRKDTNVILSTHVTGAADLTPSGEYNSAVALRTRLRMYPESSYFGTPVVRGMIVAGSGKLLANPYKTRVPLSAELAISFAQAFGRGDGRWTNGLNIDAAPGSIVKNMSDISTKYIPTSVRNRNWDAGITWVQAYDRSSYFFPALKTVYDDDTSVLNSVITAFAVSELNKVAESAWREFSGVSRLTNDQLADRVNSFIVSRTQGRFNDRFIIEPEAYFTDLDLARNYSWSLRIKIQAPGLKTVMATSIQVSRLV